MTTPIGSSDGEREAPWARLGAEESLRQILAVSKTFCTDANVDALANGHPSLIVQHLAAALIEARAALSSDREMAPEVKRLLAFEQEVEILTLPWLDVSWATDGMTPTERVLLAVQKCRETALAYQTAAREMAPEAKAEQQTDAARAVLAERERQKTVEGWTFAHDDEHIDGSMAAAAACYAMHVAIDHGIRSGHIDRYASPVHRFDKFVPDYWPWGKEWWKPDTSRRMLVKAGALILAEIERLDRASSAHPEATAKDSVNQTGALRQEPEAAGEDLASLKRDAARYRWLREDGHVEASGDMRQHMIVLQRLEGDHFYKGGSGVADYDEAIDAALASSAHIAQRSEES